MLKRGLGGIATEAVVEPCSDGSERGTRTPFKGLGLVVEIRQCSD